MLRFEKLWMLKFKKLIKMKFPTFIHLFSFILSFIYFSFQWFHSSIHSSIHVFIKYSIIHPSQQHRGFCQTTMMHVPPKLSSDSGLLRDSGRIPWNSRVALRPPSKHFWPTRRLQLHGNTLFIILDFSIEYSEHFVISFFSQKRPFVDNWTFLSQN